MRCKLEGQHFRLAVIAAVTSALAACQHAPPPSAVREGVSSFTFVDSAFDRKPAGQVADPAVEPRPSDVLLLAKPIEPLARPIYPRAALGGHSAPVIVRVRLTVDEMGAVSHVEGSPLFSTPSPFHSEFRAAIADAVAQWRFRPAVLRHLVPRQGKGGEYHWIVQRAEQAPCTFDVAFTFAETGDVTSALAR